MDSEKRIAEIKERMDARRRPELREFLKDLPAPDNAGLLNRLCIDPAVASSPLITSIADVAGLAIYFFIAAQILRSAL